MPDDSETIALRVTVIGGQRYADDYQVSGASARVSLFGKHLQRVKGKFWLVAAMPAAFFCLDDAIVPAGSRVTIDWLVPTFLGS